MTKPQYRVPVTLALLAVSLVALPALAQTGENNNPLLESQVACNEAQLQRLLQRLDLDVQVAPSDEAMLQDWQRALDSYEWRSSEARQTFEALDSLRAEEGDSVGIEIAGAPVTLRDEIGPPKSTLGQAVSCESDEEEFFWGVRTMPMKHKISQKWESSWSDGKCLGRLRTRRSAAD